MKKILVLIILVLSFVGCSNLKKQNDQVNLKGKEFRIMLMAPTGKASKVAAKATGIPCSTIHRGLRYNPAEGFEYNENNPLHAHIIIVDETSMLDCLLANSLLKAVS